ncbi:MAG: MFS transporter [Casimicrobiaceae bacterium]
MTRIPRGVWVLGFVSLLMDASSELVHSLLPLFLVSTLGASVVVVGLIEGVAESTAMFAKVVSGYLSDRQQRRKRWVLAGYGLAALSKLAFPLAASVGVVAAARFADRVGKGIRGAPRDALIADLAPSAMRGASFGLRQALDSVGALFGPILAIVAVGVFAGNVRSALWVAVIPAALCVVLIAFGLEDRAAREPSARKVIVAADVRGLDRRFAAVCAIAALMTLARFSEAFLILRAQSVGASALQAPLVMIAMSLVYALLAFPAGRWVDRGGAKMSLYVGCAALFCAHLVLAMTTTLALTLLGAALWGMHLAFTQGLFSAWVANVVPAQLRGTAFGVFNLACGVALLVASALAGILWERVSPAAAFAAGAVLIALAAVAIAAMDSRGDGVAQEAK